ncbi:hypothetical protein A2U01_0110458, partial [Trifolium medium]|nr:hypothetical protein [Trifolium medium]
MFSSTRAQVHLRQKSPTIFFE